MRPYNEDLDNYYSPDDTPELYLTENQVDFVLTRLSVINDPAEIEVREIIRDIESINRMEKLGNIREEESADKIKTLSNNFLKKYGFWPYKTKTHESFYKYFDK